MSVPLINQWANFLQNEKLDGTKLETPDVLILLRLCQSLAETGITPYEPNRSHTRKNEMRRLVCTTAFELGLDLLKIKKRKNQFGGTKPAMGRGLLDMWNEEYARKFGSNLGTAGKAEEIRRKVVSKLCEEKRKEGIDTGSDNTKIPVSETKPE